MASLTLQLVTWNGAAYLPHLFASLREQTMQGWDLVVVDNGSTDATVATLSRECARWRASATPKVQHIRNAENLGFAVGHHQAFACSTSAFVQLINQDVALAPDYLARCFAFFQTHPNTAAVQGALCRWDFPTQTRTDEIDSLGLLVRRSRQVVELGAGEEYGSVTFGEVFGVSGALPMYRRAALQAVAHDGEVLDASFFSYKEDVDLAYRLRSAGWRAFVIPAARAWHDRTAAAHRKRRHRSAIERRLSYRNHLLTLVKNEHRATLRADVVPILLHEAQKLFYLAATEWGTLRALRDLPRLVPVMLEKRRKIMERYCVAPEVIGRWFTA
ncbi:MAG: glycosyltransferase family 2 protein [bacterium]|nr:glycosyltransferase family 2 protein [bacterium]